MLLESKLNTSPVHGEMRVSTAVMTPGIKQRAFTIFLLKNVSRNVSTVNRKKIKAQVLILKKLPIQIMVITTFERCNNPYSCRLHRLLKAM